MYFTRSAGAVSVTGIEKVKKLTVRVVVQDCTGTVRFTDVMLQGGSVATAWVSMCQNRGTPLMHRRCEDGVYSICRNNQYT